MSDQPQRFAVRAAGVALAVTVVVAPTVWAQAKKEPAKPLPKLPALPPMKPPTKPGPAKPPPPTPKAGTKIGEAQKIGPGEAFDAAEKLFQDSNWEEALTAFQRFQRDYPISGLLAGAMYYEGWCAGNLRQHEVAVAAFERLLRGYPDSQLVPESTLKLAEAKRELRDFAAALTLIRQFQAKNPNHALTSQAWLEEARTLFAMKEFAAAKNLLAKFRDRFREEWETGFDAMFLLAQIYTEESNHDDAQAIYAVIASRNNNPRTVEGLYLTGQALFEQKKYPEALRFFKRVAPKAILVANVDQQLADLQARRITIIAQAGEAGYNSRLEALQKLAQQVRSRDDLRPPALFRIGNCYQSLERHDEAAVVYRHLMEKHPDIRLAESAQCGLIQTLSARGLAKEATTETEKFKAKYPESLALEGIELMEAESRFGTKDFSRALELYLKTKSVNTNQAVLEAVNFRIASCQFELKQWDKARDAYVAFTTGYPKSRAMPDVLFRLALCHYELANAGEDQAVREPNLRDAIKYFERLRVEHPLPEILPDVVFRIAYFHNMLAQYDNTEMEKAVNVLEEFRQQFPDHRYMPDVLMQIARTRVILQQSDQGIAAYQQLADKWPEDPNAPLALYEIGTTYYRMDKRDKMISTFRVLAQRFPSYAKVGDALYLIAAEYEDQARQILTSGSTNAQVEAQAKFMEAENAYRLVSAIATNAPAEAEGDPIRNAAFGALTKTAALMQQRGATNAAIAEWGTFLDQFQNFADPARRAVAQLAAIYRQAKLAREGYAKFDELKAKHQANAPIRIAALTGAIELAIGESNVSRANQAAAQLLADPEADKLPPLTYIAMGRTFLQTEQCQQAHDTFVRMANAHKDNELLVQQANVGKGKALLCLKRLDEAEAIFNEIALSPPTKGGHSDAELGLGRIAEARNNIVEAVKHYDKAILVGGRGGEAVDEAAFRCGKYFFELVEKDAKKRKDNVLKARAYFARLVFATGPMAEEAMYRVAECHEALGNPADALRSYQNYLRKFADGKFAPQAKDQIKKLSLPPK
jgi:TolA-binding protein